MELTTSQAVDLFLASLRTRSAPANTIKAYRLDLQHFLKQAPTDLSEVTADIIRVFLDSHEQHRPATRRRHAAAFRAFYAWLMQQGMVQRNPMERLEPIGQIERLPRPLDPDDVTKILKAIPASNLRDRAIFTLLYETGMRVGDYIGWFTHVNPFPPTFSRARGAGDAALDGVGERYAPRATGGSALMSVTVPGRSRSASLPTPSRVGPGGIACSAPLA